MTLYVAYKMSLLKVNWMKELIGQEEFETNVNKKTTGKKWDNWYGKQCKGEEREVKTALKDYEKGNDEARRSKHYTCQKECVNRLDELRKVGRE